jgi:O-methyltransferase
MSTKEQLLDYKRSFVANLARLILNAAHKCLPQRAYNWLYNSMRLVYWAFQRTAYRCRVISARLGGNTEYATKVRLVHELLPYTMGGPLALESAFDVTARVERNKVDGALVECGVARGGCAAMMGLASKHFGADRKLWLFDSYEGLPEPTNDDFKDGAVGRIVGPLAAGMLVGTIEQVSDLMFNTCGFSKDRVSLVKGWFQDTLPVTKDTIGEIALLRLDGDWYESTKCCLDNLYDQVTPGGCVIIDDYATCFGCEKAVTEFLESRNIVADLVPDGRGGAWFHKPTSPL